MKSGPATTPQVRSARVTHAGVATAAALVGVDTPAASDRNVAIVSVMLSASLLVASGYVALERPTCCCS